MGSSWLAGQLWERLGIAAGILKVATDRRVDAELVERVIFSMVANRLSVKPLSKLAGCTWVRQRAFVEGLTDVSDDACYPAMDVLIGGIAQLHKTVFFSVANLLNLEVDLLFFDTTSTYWETDRLEEDLEHGADDNDESLPHAALHERGTRVYNSASKDHRPDLPQVVLGMAVTRRGNPGSGLDLRRGRERPGDHQEGRRRPGQLEPLPGHLGARPRVHQCREPAGRVLRGTVDQADLQALPPADRLGQTAHRPGSGRTRGQARPQVLTAHLRREPVSRGHSPRLQGALRSRERVARHQVHHRTCGRSITTAKTVSALTSSCAGWR